MAQQQRPAAQWQAGKIAFTHYWSDKGRRNVVEVGRRANAMIAPGEYEARVASIGDYDLYVFRAPIIRNGKQLPGAQWVARVEWPHMQSEMQTSPHLCIDDCEKICEGAVLRRIEQMLADYNHLTSKTVGLAIVELEANGAS